MRSPSKLIIGVTAAATIVAPFAPKTVNINVTNPSAVVADVQMCVLFSTIIDDRGKRYCEYRCGTQLRITPIGPGCEKLINKKLIK
jgi:hypothetical protein